VLVRVSADANGRYRVAEFHLFPTDDPITAERLRAIRVSAIEQLLNLPEEREAIEARLNERREGNVLPTWAAQIQDFLRDFRLPTFREAEATPGPPANLTAPDRRGYPDDFYERVAQTYRDALRRGGRPVAAVMTEAGVPRSTAARWVKEARRRGLLGDAPAQGKAGG
jgi:hypothetical protein